MAEVAGALGSGPVEAMGGDVERVTLNKRAAATAAMEEMPSKVVRIERSESTAAPDTEDQSTDSEMPCSMSEVPRNESEVPRNKSEVPRNKSEVPRNKPRFAESEEPYKESEMSCTESGAAFKSVTSGLVNENTMEVAHIMGTMVRQAMEGGAPMLQAWMANKRPAGN